MTFPFCESCDRPWVPMSHTEAVLLDFHRAVHRCGRETAALMEPFVDMLAAAVKS